MMINKVVGDSMSPTIEEGDYVISHSLPWYKYDVGDIVICDHFEYQRIVKRIIRKRDNGDFYLSGDGEKSIASNDIGWQSQCSLKGKVFKTISI